MVNPAVLNLNEKINLFIPTFLTPVYLLHRNILGKVRSTKEEKSDDAHLYEVVFNEEAGATIANGLKEFAQQLPSDSALIEMLIQLIKDSLILKQGIIVYFKHLTPYFSRLIDYSDQEYRDFKQTIIKDIENKIKTNESELEELYHSIKTVKKSEDIPILLNLEYLRENMESEINIDLFLLAFSSLRSRDDLLELLKKSIYQANFRSIYYYTNYLITIKNLENRLYSNYNQIVSIYLKCI